MPRLQRAREVEMGIKVTQCKGHASVNTLHLFSFAGVISSACHAQTHATCLYTYKHHKHLQGEPRTFKDRDV